MSQKRRSANRHGILSLWVNWALPLGLIVLLHVLHLFISNLLVPGLAIVFAFFLLTMAHRNWDAKLPGCYRIPYVAAIIIFLSAIIMIVINILNSDRFFNERIMGDLSNRDIPYIPILIMAPTALAVSLWNLRKGTKSGFCQFCQMTNGSTAERGFLGKLFSHEGSYQCQLLMLLSLLLTIVVWLYYSFFYINVNINSPDTFFFVWAPLIMYLLSLIYLGLRYISFWAYYCQKVDEISPYNCNSILVRFLIISGDKMFLQEMRPAADKSRAAERKIDTPALKFSKYKKSISEAEAATCFSELSGIADPRLRFIYASSNFNAECNILHYACIVDEMGTIDGSNLEGEWYTLSQLEAQIAKNRVSPLLIAELKRIYTVTMAWKTYDKKGKRLYGIRHYKPTFKLSDFKNWNVDFNDTIWLFISMNNQDSRFFALRRFWHRHVNNIGE